MRRLPRVSPRDAVAGVSVAFLVIPQSLAYAQLAGLPPYRGLYASAIPPAAAAPFGSSPYLQPGPTAITSLLTLGALTPLAAIGSGHYVRLALLLALVAGVARLLVGLVRAGWLAYLVSEPMLLGFVPASALLIVATQLPFVLGVPRSGGVLHAAGVALGHPGRWNWQTIALAFGIGAGILVANRVHRLFPGVLVAALVGLAIGAWTGYSGSLVGPVPEGAPPISVDLPWGDLPSLLLPGVIIALVGFAEIASIARTYAVLDRTRWDPNREWTAQGVANVAAALSGGFPVGGSFSRSALNRLAGAHTSASSLVTGAAVLVLLPFAGFLGDLPQAVLAATVIVSVLGLIRIRPLLELWRHSRPQFALAWIVFAATLGFAPRVQWAVVLGIGLAVVIHLARELRIEVDAAYAGRTLHLHPRGVLWFGSARALEDAFLAQLAAHPEAQALTIHLRGLGRIDISGALALRRLLDNARETGLEIEVNGLPARWRGLVLQSAASSSSSKKQSSRAPSSDQ